MTKNETPQRWTPSRRPVWFDGEDVSRMVAALRETYSPIVSATNISLSPMVISMVFRFPDQTFQIGIRTRDTWKPDVAKMYLAYLGFPKDFSDAYLTMYSREDSNLTSNKKFSTFMWKALFSSLSSYDSGELRKILAHDKESTAKWGQRLRTCRSTWGALKIPDRAVRRIIAAFYREIHGAEMNDKALESRVRMYVKKEAPLPQK